MWIIRFFTLSHLHVLKKGQKGVENQNRLHRNNNNLKSLSPKPSSIVLQSLELFFWSLLIRPWVIKKVQVIWEKVDIFLFYLYLRTSYKSNYSTLLQWNWVPSFIILIEHSLWAQSSNPLLLLLILLLLFIQVLIMKLSFFSFFFFAFFNSLSKKMNNTKTKTRY